MINKIVKGIVLIIIVLVGAVNMIGCQSTEEMGLEEAVDILSTEEEVGVFDIYDATDEEVECAQETVEDAILDAKIEAAINDETHISEYGVGQERKEVEDLYKAINEIENNIPEIEEVDYLSEEDAYDTILSIAIEMYGESIEVGEINHNGLTYGANIEDVNTKDVISAIKIDNVTGELVEVIE